MLQSASRNVVTNIVSSQSIFELNQLHKVVKGGDLEHYQLSPGSFYGKSTRINLGTIILDIGEYNRAINAQGSLGSRQKTFLLALNKTGKSNGIPINQDQFIAYGSGEMADAYGDDNIKWATVTVLKEEWPTLFLDMDNWIEVLDQPRVSGVRPSQRTMASFLDIVQTVSNLADNNPERLEQASIQGLVRKELIEYLQFCLAESKGNQGAAIYLPLHNRYHVVREADEYIKSNLDQNLMIVDICSNLGVAERTLQYAFKDVLDITPYRYIRLLRFNQARKALLRASPDQTNITKVAMNCGFWHMGRFSRDYKAFFGEFPFETLRRVQE